MATAWRWPPERDLTGETKFVKFGFRRPMTLRVASSMAPSSSVPQRVVDLPAEEDVGRRVDVVGQGQRLVDGLDVVGLGVARVADARRLAVDEDLAAVGGMGAREDAHERRLAGAVAADEADDLAGVEVDGHVAHGVDAAEGDVDVLHLDERECARRRSWLPHDPPPRRRL